MTSKQKGYTLIEVMLFLAISSALFVMTVLGMGNQQNRVRFKNGMEDIEFRIRSTLSNVDQGYAAKADNSKNYTCLAGLAAQAGVSSTASCVFLGREINLCGTTDNSWYVVSKVAPYNNNDYTTSNGSLVGVVDSDQEIFASPSGIKLVTTALPDCRVSALYQTVGTSNNRVPRYKATDISPTINAIDDANPLKLCFHDTQGTDDWAMITITQADVKLEIDTAPCG